MRTMRTIGELRGFVLAGVAAAALAFGGCSTTKSMFSSGQTWTLSTSPKVPASAGKVTVKPESGGNARVKVEVEHLAPADRVYEGTPHYVVWIMPKGGGLPQNVGILNVGENLKGDIETTTPFKDFDVLVTAEASPDVSMPGGNRVMHTTVHVAS